MNEPAQPGWTRLRTATGRYEYQFQGAMPTVRAGEYQQARDYQFLVLDEEGWLYKIPVRLIGEVAGEEAAEPDGSPQRARIAEAQLRAGLETYRPHQGAPYEEMDALFTVDAPRARELRGNLGPR